MKGSVSPGAWACFWWTSKWILMECSRAEHVGFRADLSFSGVNGKRKAELQAITVLLSSMHCAWKLLFISLLAECVKCVSAWVMFPFSASWQTHWEREHSGKAPSPHLLLPFLLLFCLTVGFHLYGIVSLSQLFFSFLFLAYFVNLSSSPLNFFLFIFLFLFHFPLSLSFSAKGECLPPYDYNNGYRVQGVHICATFSLPLPSMLNYNNKSFLCKSTNL